MPDKAGYTWTCVGGEGLGTRTEEGKEKVWRQTDLH